MRNLLERVSVALERGGGWVFLMISLPKKEDGQKLPIWLCVITVTFCNDLISKKIREEYKKFMFAVLL